jgi:hypothetical protein
MSYGVYEGAEQKELINIVSGQKGSSLGANLKFTCFNVNPNHKIRPKTNTK